MTFPKLLKLILQSGGNFLIINLKPFFSPLSNCVWTIGLLIMSSYVTSLFGLWVLALSALSYLWPLLYHLLSQHSSEWVFTHHVVFSSIFTTSDLTLYGGASKPWLHMEIFKKWLKFSCTPIIMISFLHIYWDLYNLLKVITTNS